MESQILTDDTFSAQDEYGNDVFMLITDSQEIRATLAGIGRFDLADDAGLLLVAASGGDYDQVWYSEHSVAYLGITVYRIYPA